MRQLPAYLAKARAAPETMAHVNAREQRARETSEKSEKRRRFEAGGRYQVAGPIVGVIHPTVPEIDGWREEAGFPRAGLMTIDGQVVLVADITLALKSGWMDVLGVPR